LGEKNIQSCHCLVYLDAENPLLEANRLETVDKTKEIATDIKCDNRGEFMCKALCKENVRKYLSFYYKILQMIMKLF
jgi:hypothetical protein